ncbi:hypothetical protein [Virgisporangium ochraceum]|uniref:SWIM-type domain-containing protein n=1 Tax=Virgisporangium ochraceum TaxID=65505 RepID=A0A8J4E9Y1_9ACTN|nr:hypothetical protein [Virgisporangium ochraceum]GIJ66924.1 hypothetical protein Voc01_018410 [Virgisporangium ochraceum]
MSGLPGVPPAVVAEAVEALPTRLRKKLDEVVTRAAAWPVSTVDAGTVVVRVDDDTTVTLRVPVRAAGDVTCTCLMAPRCAHRAAVLSTAPPAEDAAAGDTATGDTATGDTATGEAPAGAVPAGAGSQAGAAPAPAGDAAAEAAAFSAAEVAAADGLWVAGAAVLTRGIAGAGAVQQAVLLRAAHEARSLGLHRASTAAVRVVRSARAARADDPAFRLADLVAAVHELLEVSHRIRHGTGSPASLRGVARRSYVDRGDLRLYGLCCVPVLDPTGYAGAVTYLTDAKGTLYQVNDVTPGGLELATGRPGNPVRIGEARLTFRELGHAGLFVSAARASADGRLSNAGTVRAVRGSGRPWTDDPLARHWTRTLSTQVAAYHDALRLPAEERPAGHDLAFLTGRTGPADDSGVRFTTADGRTVRLTVPTDNPGLPYLSNLRMLAEVAGEVRLIGRFAGDGRVEALAASWTGLPDARGSHVDLGVDILLRAWLPHPGSEPPEDVATDVPPEPPPDLPLYLLSRRVQRAVEGGAQAAAGAPRDPVRLTAAGLPTAAALAGSLDRLAVDRPRDEFGRPAGHVDDLATTWLSAAAYLDAVAARMATDTWLAAAQ